MTRRFAWLLPVMALGSAGCMASQTQLKQRASADFQCAPDKLSVNEVRSDVYEVSGCDQKESYVYNADAQAWVRESEAGGKVIR